VAPEPDRVAFGREHAAYWERLGPIAADAAVGRYLLGRGCPLPTASADLRLDPCRRHPHQRDWVGPAMVARITDAITAAPLSFHVTWVSLDGAGKAPLERPRLIARGTTKRGGVVRLCDDTDVGVGLAIAEGIETALSATSASGWRSGRVSTPATSPPSRCSPASTR
jgi:hypothetical protein